jgi:xylose isomerase
LGSIDANRGDPQNGWDTDQFPNSIEEMSLVIYRLLLNGGFTNGGFNFDSKVRRQSINLDDMFYGHIGGIDVLARSLIIANKMKNDALLEKIVKNRYSKWDSNLGKSIMSGVVNISDLSLYINNIKDRLISPASGKQEMIENIITRYIHE